MPEYDNKGADVIIGRLTLKDISIQIYVLFIWLEGIYLSFAIHQRQ